ncbi:universal stress protein [Phytohabitans kaempferiae]|uniref:Universal stress protein n=2 Tax=Phytohabitans kaempferiae TaxID=1620943 RepID=A0ABV6M589_9ACTN
MDDHVRPVVVGVDGSAASGAAADYAAGVAHGRSLPLHLVYGYLRKLTYGAPIDPLEMAEPVADRTAARQLEEISSRLSAKWPDLQVQIQEILGEAAPELIEKSRQAELVVIGSRGRGGFTGLLLGSVSAKVAAHAYCPVVVVRPPNWSLDASSTEQVVVGVDGSSESMLALDLGSDEAARLGQSLAVIHTHSEIPAAPQDHEPTTTAQENAKALLADAVNRARGRHPDLTVRDEMVYGAGPKLTLIEASRSATLVALGSRGRGGFAGMMLGSVSQALVHHSECPVLIAHHYLDSDPETHGAPRP